MSLKIGPGRRVKLNYTLAVDGGQVLESSKNSGPLEYIHGTGKMLPGLERCLEGAERGAKLDGVISPEEAYGTEDSLPTTHLPRKEFKDEPKVGAQFEAKAKDGTPLSFKIIAVEDEKIVVRLMHPLVGKSIRYEVEVLDIRPGLPPVQASPAETTLELDPEEVEMGTDGD